MDSYLKQLAQEAVAPMLQALNNTTGEISGATARFATAQITSVTQGPVADDIIAEAAKQTAQVAKAVAETLAR